MGKSVPLAPIELQRSRYSGVVADDRQRERQGDRREKDSRMKISGSFRTFDAAQTFADIGSVISTARKHGLNILDTLTQPRDQIIARL
jgi:hypothetical protein